MASLVPSEEDVAAGVRARLTGAAGYAAAIPGGVHYQRRPAGKAFPYVVLSVESGEREDVDSGGTYTQRFTVTATAWVQSTDAAAAATTTARTFLDANLGGGIADPSGGITVANSVGVVHALRKGGRLRLAPELRAGQDVLATAAILDVTVEGRQE